MPFGVEWEPLILLFGWIPFWWAVGAISLYRMNRNDERNADLAAGVADREGPGGR